MNTMGYTLKPKLAKRYLQIVKYICACVLILNNFNWLHSQTFDICGYQTDSVYTYTENVINLNIPFCEKAIIQIIPNIHLKRDSCSITFFTNAREKSYQLLITYPDYKIDTFQLYTAKSYLGFALITNRGFIPRKPVITKAVAQQIQGIMAISNCPWLRGACPVKLFDFYIEHLGEIIYQETVQSGNFSNDALVEISHVRSGSVLHFSDIRINCPGDDGWNQDFHEVIIKVK